MDDPSYIVDVDTPGGHVGGHERLQSAGPEGCKRPLSFALSAVPVDGRRGRPCAPQALSDPVGTVFSTDENDRRAVRARPVQRTEQSDRRLPQP